MYYQRRYVEFLVIIIEKYVYFNDKIKIRHWKMEISYNLVEFSNRPVGGHTSAIGA